MGRLAKPPAGIERAVELGSAGPSHPDQVNTVQGEPHNPYSYNTPCYWTWHGANEARKRLEVK